MVANGAPHFCTSSKSLRVSLAVFRLAASTLICWASLVFVTLGLKVYNHPEVERLWVMQRTLSVFIPRSCFIYSRVGVYFQANGFPSRSRSGDCWGSHPAGCPMVFISSAFEFYEGFRSQLRLRQQ